jgi:protein tyrosine/serine phosphatase
MRIAIPALLPLLCLSATAAAPVDPARADVHLSAPVSPSPPGVENFGVVWDGKLYRGAQPEIDGVDGYQSLIAAGVRTIVDLTNEPIDHWIMDRRGDCSRMPPSDKQTLKYVRIPESVAFPRRADLLRFLRIAKQPENQPIFVHCAEGENRTGAMVAGLRIVLDDWTLDDAIAEMTNFGVRRIWLPINRRFIESTYADRAAIRRELESADETRPVVLSCP